MMLRDTQPRTPPDSHGESTGTIIHTPMLQSHLQRPNAALKSNTSSLRLGGSEPQQTLVVMDDDDASADRSFTSAELLMATGQSVTPSMLADQEKLMHERRILAIHNTRLVLALQSLGAIGEEAMEALQHRAAGRGARCLDCDAAQTQLGALDKVLARSSLSLASAKEQIAALTKRLSVEKEEVRTLRNAITRYEELLTMQKAENAALQMQVSQTQPALEEVLALRRTQTDLMHRIRVLQTSEPVVRIIEGSQRRMNTTRVDAEVQTLQPGSSGSSVGSPSLEAPPKGARSRSALQLAQLEAEEESARMQQLLAGFNFHHLLGMVRHAEANNIKLSEFNARLLAERQELEDAHEDLGLRFRDLQIELRTERTRSEMQTPPASLPPRAPTLPTTLSSAAASVAPFNRSEVEASLKAEVWEWARTRVEATLDEAMDSIQQQVDTAFREGFNAGRLAATGDDSWEQEPQQQAPHRERRHPSNIDSVTSIDDT